MLEMFNVKNILTSSVFLDFFFRVLSILRIFQIISSQHLLAFLYLNFFSDSRRYLKPFSIHLNDFPLHQTFYCRIN